MSLKGYQWLDDEGNAIMGYFFKDRMIFLWKDTTKEEFDKFIEWLHQRDFTYCGINFNDHHIKGFASSEEEL